MNRDLYDAIVSCPILISVGWSLFHFVWQAILIALVVAISLLLTQRSSARIRYLIGCLGLVAMMLSPMITLAWLQWMPASSGDLPITPQVALAMHTGDINDALIPPIAQLDPLPNVETPALNPPANAMDWAAASTVLIMTNGHDWSHWKQAMQSWLPMMVLIWLAGVAVLLLRLLLGLFQVRNWRKESQPLKSADVANIVDRLSRQIGLRRSVAILECARATVPAVVGWLRPAILLPVSMVWGLKPCELESILAHELAHIRRHDYLVNLLQLLVETGLFYHPAVWWLSGRIRAERENCCDDIAVEICGNRLALARALARMEELRFGQESWVVAANGASLVARIRRIVDVQPVRAGNCWPAGTVAFSSLLVLASTLFLCICFSTAVADPQVRADTKKTVPTEDLRNRAWGELDDQFETRKQEQTRLDSKTGHNARVFDDIRLATVKDGQWRRASLSMKYSNLFSYSLIPARIAKELNARELGEIDFGTEPPQMPTRFQSELLDLADEQPAVFEEQNRVKPITVNELTDPVTSDQQIVPYPDEAVFLPHHLGFYGMNSKQQHKFKIVRIDRIALGVGPSFGPINALVLDDENSDFGLLGTDWTQQVRGDKGEGLWFSAADAAFFFMASKQEPEPDQSAPQTTPPPTLTPDTSFEVESSHGNAGPSRQDRDGVKVLASHNYDLSHRRSTHLVTINNTSVPVDHAVEHDGVKVYQTLMFDIVALDAKTGKVLWHQDWNKGEPFWKTVSIVELENGEREKQKAVELFSVDPTRNELIYKYFLLTTGAELTPPVSKETRAYRLQHVPATLVAKLLSARMNPPNSPDAPVRIVAEVVSNSILMVCSEVELKEAVEFLKELDRPEMAEMLRNDPTNRWLTDVIPLTVVEKDDSTIKRIELRARSQGRSPNDLVQRWKAMHHFNIETADSITEAETLVSVDQNARSIGNAVDADEIIFNLPEGSGMRAEFFGEKVEIVTVDDQKSVVVTNGKVQLLDQGGVVRAWASPDGGAEQLLASIREDSGEYVMRLKAQRLVHDPNFIPNMQCVTFPETGAPADEDQPPHGAVRYEVVNDPAAHTFRFKIKWRYDVQRIRQETPSVNQAGELSLPSVAESIRNHQEQAALSQVGQNLRGLPWGRKAEHSGLQSRLTIQSTDLEVGKPIKVKLELKNSGDQPTKVDLQNYFPQRVLRAERTDRVAGRFAPLIALPVQTVGRVITLQPGQTHEVWSEVDLTEILLLSEPGEYVVCAEGGEWATQPLWRDSNRVKFDLKPGVLPPRISLINALHKRLPEPRPNWKLSSGYGSIFLSHSPTNLKQDVTTIQFVFLEPAEAEKLRNSERSGDTVTELGPTQFGEAFLIAPNRIIELWPNYREVIKEELNKLHQLDARRTNSGQSNDQKTESNGTDKNPSADATDNRQPWRAIGRITDVNGKPMSGVTVNANCGAGTLFTTGSTVSDGQGRYVLDFGPGIWSDNPKLVQAATISVRLPGFSEKNLHRQGDCVAAFEKPDEEKFWGDRTLEHLFLPDQPKEIDFVMVPAARLRGVLFDQQGNKAANYRVALTGKELPPSSSVVSSVRTDENGEFEFTDIPTGFAFQLRVEPPKAESPWLAWASMPVKFCAVNHAKTQIEFGQLPDTGLFQRLNLTLRGEGINWRDALKEDAAPALELTWNETED